MTTIEIVAALFGVAGVWLSVRQNVWNWPIGIVNVALYVAVFYQAKLYADMGLQVIYIGLALYGWYQWLYGGPGRTTLPVRRAGPRRMLLAPAASAWIGCARSVPAYLHLRFCLCHKSAAGRRFPFNGGQAGRSLFCGRGYRSQAGTRRRDVPYPPIVWLLFDQWRPLPVAVRSAPPSRTLPAGCSRSAPTAPGLSLPA